MPFCSHGNASNRYLFKIAGRLYSTRVLFFQFTNHRTLEAGITQYTLESLYPNSLYHVWVAAKSKRGEGATTPPLSARTEQYCKLLIK